MQTKQKHIEDWKKFWNTNINLIKNVSSKTLKQYDINPLIFDDFYNFLATGQSASDNDFNLDSIFNPIIQTEGQFAFINIIPSDADIIGLENIDTVIISNASLQDKISSDISSRFIKIMTALLISSFVVLFLIFKNFKLAVLSILPPVCGICMFFISAAILNIEVNLIGLYALPLLIGLGVDYAIFMIYQNKIGAELHPTKAVIIAALSTLIGFGALMTARHTVLFIIGFMIFIGILTAILTSIFILPPLLKRLTTEKI
jgi:predicted RND superfamily exporter protein